MSEKGIMDSLGFSEHHPEENTCSLSQFYPSQLKLNMLTHHSSKMEMKLGERLLVPIQPIGVKWGLLP